MSTADIRAGALNVRITRDSPRTLTFVGLAPLYEGDWTATVDEEDLSTSVDGDDVVVEFTGDEASGTLTILADETVVITGRLSVSGRGTAEPAGSVLVRLDEQDITVSVVGGGIPGLEAEAAARAAADAVLTAAVATKATPADITAAVNNLVAAAPGALDTLNELAAALGDDPNFAATMTTALAGKQASGDYVTATQFEAGSSGRELAYAAGSATAQTGISTITDVTGLTVTFTVRAAHPAYVFAELPDVSVATAASTGRMSITDEANDPKARTRAGFDLTNTAREMHAMERITAAGTYTRKVRLERTAGSGTLSVNSGSDADAIGHLYVVER